MATTPITNLQAALEVQAVLIERINTTLDKLEATDRILRELTHE